MNLDNNVGVVHIGLLGISKEIIEYCNSFGLNCPKEVIKMCNRLNINDMHNSTKYHDLVSVLHTLHTYALYFSFSYKII